MPGAGALKERVIFQQRQLDENGDRRGDWDLAGQVSRRANVFTRSGSEQVIHARLQGVQPVEITVRRDAGTRQVTAAWRAVWNGQPFNIRAAPPDLPGPWITFLAEADQSDG